MTSFDCAGRVPPNAPSCSPDAIGGNDAGRLSAGLAADVDGLRRRGRDDETRDGRRHDGLPRRLRIEFQSAVEVVRRAGLSSVDARRLFLRTNPATVRIDLGHRLLTVPDRHRERRRAGTTRLFARQRSVARGRYSHPHGEVGVRRCRGWRRRQIEQRERGLHVVDRSRVAVEAQGRECDRHVARSARQRHPVGALHMEGHGGLALRHVDIDFAGSWRRRIGRQQHARGVARRQSHRDDAELCGAERGGERANLKAAAHGAHRRRSDDRRRLIHRHRNTVGSETRRPGGRHGRGARQTRRSSVRRGRRPR